MDKTQNLNIIFKDSIFDSNMLIITRLSTLLFKNFSFQKDKIKDSASTIVVSLQQGDLKIVNSIFIQNIVTNSTDSILRIKAASIDYKHILLQQQYHFLQQHEQKSANFQLSNEQDLTITFPINSKKQKWNLGCFQDYFEQSNDFQPQIKALQIQKIHNFTILKLPYDVLHILQAVAFILMHNQQHQNQQIFVKFFSRREGGGLYIIPSSQNNEISMKQLKISNCFSIQNTFFSFQYLNLEQVKFNINLNQIDFTQTEKVFFTLLELPIILEFDTIRSNNPIIMVKYEHQDCELQLLSNSHIESNQNRNIGIINSSFQDASLIKITLINCYFIFIISGSKWRNLVSEFILIKYTRNLEPSKKSCFLKDQEFHQQSYQIIQSHQYQSNLSIQCKVNATPTVELNLIELDTSWQHLQIKCNLKKIYEKRIIILSLLKFKKQMKIIKQYVNLQFKVYQLYQMFGWTDYVFGYTGFFSIISQWNENALNTEMIFTNPNERQLQQHDYTKLTLSLNHQVKIIDSLFFNNSAIFGGSLFIVEAQVVIQNSRFQHNSSIVGGAVYDYSNSANLFIFVSFYIENIVQMAGGIFVHQQSIQQTIQLDLIILNNTSSTFSQDIFESPRSLTLSIDTGKTFLKKKVIQKTTTKVIEQIEINPYNILGYSQKENVLTLENSKLIPYNLTFRIIPLNKFNQQLKKLPDSFCIISHYVLNLSNNTILTQFKVHYQKLEYNLIKIPKILAQIIQLSIFILLQIKILFQFQQQIEILLKFPNLIPNHQTKLPIALLITTQLLKLKHSNAKQENI
ncbi:unnamed protein product [Paramecium primaurelia]|uniref:Uncharacterized protein n=1 Tax=Paramecium primaurelia TaxID=5886 RepID=A0A8S1QHY9_PARPR|nr:unnamed protein product [Paramecium primaurelia]